MREREREREKGPFIRGRAITLVCEIGLVKTKPFFSFQRRLRSVNSTILIFGCEWQWRERDLSLAIVAWWSQSVNIQQIVFSRVLYATFVSKVLPKPCSSSFRKCQAQRRRSSIPTEIFSLLRSLPSHAREREKRAKMKRSHRRTDGGER